MKATVENTDPLHSVIRVELPWESISKELDEAYRELSRNTDIKGFRKGKVPRSVLQKRFGKRVEDDVISRLVAESYEEALVIHRVKAVSKPEMEKGRLEPGQSFRYTAKVEIHPQIDLKKLDILVEKPEPTVTTHMLTEALENLREQHAVLTPIENRRQARSGDAAVVDYDAKLDGRLLEGGQVKNNTILLGSGKSVPGFEDQVIGMELTEKKEFELAFPEDWSLKKLAGKTVQFSVTLNAIKNRELPELGDEFAKDVGRESVETLEDLKNKLQADLLTQEKDRIQHEIKEKLIDGLIQANPFPVPPALVDRQQEALAQEVENMLSIRGMEAEQVGLRRQQMKKELKERAEREVKAALLLDAVAENKKITVGSDEIEAAFEKMALRVGKNIEQIRAWYSDSHRRQELHYKLLQEKVLDYLLNLPHIGGDRVEVKEELPQVDKEPEQK